MILLWSLEYECLCKKSVHDTKKTTHHWCMRDTGTALQRLDVCNSGWDSTKFAVYFSVFLFTGAQVVLLRYSTTTTTTMSAAAATQTAEERWLYVVRFLFIFKLYSSTVMTLPVFFSSLLCSWLDLSYRCSACRKNGGGCRHRTINANSYIYSANVD